MLDENQLNYIRSILIDLEAKDKATLELVGAFISKLELSEDAKYNLWVEWLSYSGAEANDTIYNHSKILATVTIDQIQEAVANKLRSTEASLADFEITKLNFTTPKAVAKQFVAMYNKPLRYVADLDKWLEWNGSHWDHVEEVFLSNVLANAVDRMFKKHELIDGYTVEDGLKAFARTYNKVSGLNEVLKTLKAQHEIEVVSKDLDNDSNVIGCINGAVDLRTGELVQTTFSQYLTMNTNVRFNPTAKCPVWIKTVNDIFYDDSEMVSFFKTLIGYSLLGNNKEHILCIPYGSGANGKSTVFNTLADIFGDYGRSTAFTTFTKSSDGSAHREDLVRLQGARFVYTSEPDAFGALKEGLIKTMTGGDVMTERTAYARKSVEIKPNWITFIPTNHKPIIRGVDEGIWRRMLFIPFKRNFRLEPDLLDLMLPEKLKLEHEGILNWIIEGAIEYQLNGLSIPEALEDDKKEYREELDTVGNWIAVACTTEATDSDINQNLWASFSKFVKDKGLDTDIKSSQKLSNNLASKGYARAKRNESGNRGFYGIKVKPSVTR